MRATMNWKRWGCIFLSALCIGTYGCGEKKPDDVKEEVSSPEETAKYSLVQTAQKLQKDAYTDSTLTDLCYGLSDPGNVGVVKEDFDKVLYPIPSDEEFEGEIINWSEYSYQGDNLLKLKAILKEAAEKNAQGIKVKLNMPENEVIDMDTYRADSYSYGIVQKGLDGFYLQGNGCTFNVQYHNLDYRGFLQLEDGGDIHFENLTIDYEVPPSVNGVIQSYDTDNLSVTFTVSPECNEWIKRLQVNKGTVYSYLEYNKANLIPKDGGTYVVDSSGSNTMFSDYAITGDEKSGYKMTIYFGEAAETNIKANGVGDYVSVQFSYYVFNNLDIQNCGNIYLEGVTMHSSPAMGVVGFGNENMYINRLKITLKEGTQQRITTNADAIHILQNSGEVQVTNSLIENCHDDAMNLKSGYWYDLAGYDVLEQTITMARASESVEMPKAGETLEIYDRESFEKKTSLTVESVTGTELCYIVKVKEALVDQDIEKWTDCVVANDSSASLLFKNNIVQNKRNRGLIIMAGNAVFENNTFQNVAHGGIFTWAVLDNFNEAGIAGDSVFKNNKFINVNYENAATVGDIYVQAVASTYGPCGIIQNMKIENNFFSKSAAASVSLVSVEDAVVSHNLYYNPSRAYEGTDSVVFLYNSDKVVMEGNYCYCPESASLKGVYPGGTTTEKSVAMSDNTGLSLSSGSDFVANSEQQVAYLDKQTIELDGDMSDWTVGTDFVMAGASTEDERNAEESWYADNFKVKMAKIAYNDQGIYLGFDVYDNELVFKETENFWYGDCVEIFMTASTEMPNADMRLYRNLSDTLQLVCVLDWKTGYYLEEDRTSASIVEQGDKFEAKVVRTEDGYCGEVFIPFEVVPDFKEAVDNGQGIAINCVFADAERGNMPRIQLANVPHLVEQNKKMTATSIRYIFSKEQ